MKSCLVNTSSNAWVIIQRRPGSCWKVNCLNNWGKRFSKGKWWQFDWSFDSFFRTFDDIDGDLLTCAAVAGKVLAVLLQEVVLPSSKLLLHQRVGLPHDLIHRPESQSVDDDGDQVDDRVTLTHKVLPRTVPGLVGLRTVTLVPKDVNNSSAAHVDGIVGVHATEPCHLEKDEDVSSLLFICSAYEASGILAILVGSYFRLHRYFPRSNE